MNDKKEQIETNHSYEYYEKELNKIITELESGNIDSLEKMIENYEYGANLIEKCEILLKNAELRVQKITDVVNKGK